MASNHEVNSKRGRVETTRRVLVCCGLYNDEVIEKSFCQEYYSIFHSYTYSRRDHFAQTISSHH